MSLLRVENLHRHLGEGDTRCHALRGVGFTIEGYDSPLMGNGLILGSTASGDSKSTALSVHEVAEKVRCFRKVSRMLIRSADPANVR